MSDQKHTSGSELRSKIDFERVRSVWKKRDSGHAIDPGSVLEKKSVTVRLVDTFVKEGQARSFTIKCDEPEKVGGIDAAPQPTEFMLMSLGFCQMSILTVCAMKLRVQVDDIEISVTGYRDDRGLAGAAEVRPGYYRIEMVTKIVSSEPRSRIEKLARIAEERCPVFDNLTNPTPVSNRVLHAGEVILSRDAGELRARPAPRSM